MKMFLIVCSMFLLVSCAQQDKDNKGQQNANSTEILQTVETKTPIPQKPDLVNKQGVTISERFNLPEGFQRVNAPKGSFAEYLRGQKLKPHGSKVLYYNGIEKSRNVYAAVIDMEIGKSDLQQCADAVMRLRAEYLYKKQLFDKIHFNFTNGFRVDYSMWMNGYRIKVVGNKAYWVKTAKPSNDYASFRRYMDIVFAYAGTLSLSQEMEPIKVEDMQIGDVFIKGGSPGHSVIVVDMAENKTTGEKLFVIAQSYMPAQDIQILKNDSENGISPWYKTDFGDTLDTPEWEFEKGQLMRFGQ